ncbi:MAG: NAD(P)-dependent oxidoreductase, partial [Candidatus Puniceispirillaceae bacterium]
MKIGFIGLGNMGAPMARNLAKAGHEVTGFDVNFEQASALLDILTIAETAADAAAGQDVVITMLPHGGALNDVAVEIVPVMASSSCFIDCSTVDIQTTKQVAMMIGSAGLRGLDAPVSGGEAGAVNGVLTVMIGGEQAVYDNAAPLIDCFARARRLMGPSGAGQLTKMVNQICIAGLVQGLSEALNFGQNAGLDMDKVLGVVS